MVTNIRLNTRNCAFYKIVPITGTFIDKITTSNTLKDLKILGSFYGWRGVEGGGVGWRGGVPPVWSRFPTWVIFVSTTEQGTVLYRYITPGYLLYDTF